MRRIWTLPLLLLALPGCAAQPSGDAPAQSVKASLLAHSTPANGATVAAPVDTLQLKFSRPARLIEVTVDGPDGLSPMMITAAGETTDFSVPLPGLGMGSYRVNWKASSAGQPSTGVIAFTVR